MSIDKNTLLRAFELMATAKTMSEKYEANKEVTAKYVHATSRGHEAIQLAVGLQLQPQDWVSPYYRDDSILLGIGLTPSVTNTVQSLGSINSGLVNAISKGKSFALNSEETITSDYIFVRVKNSDFNYTTNPSMISGSGEFYYPSLINNPQTYVTTVGLYNDNNELLGVAKLSKPLVKDFTKEALIRVKLDF